MQQDPKLYLSVTKNDLGQAEFSVVYNGLPMCATTRDASRATKVLMSAIDNPQVLTKGVVGLYDGSTGEMRTYSLDVFRRRTKLHT